MAKEISRDKDLTKELIHDWTILSMSSSVDEQNQLLSLYNIIETINVGMVVDEQQKNIYKEKGWYAVPFNQQLVTRFIKKDINLDLVFDIQYEITDPSGNKIGKEFGSEINFGKGLDSLRIRNTIGDFPLTTDGWYTILTKVKRKGSEKYIEQGKVSFKVIINFQGQS